MSTHRDNLNRMLGSLDSWVASSFAAAPNRIDFKEAMSGAVRLIMHEAGDVDREWAARQIDAIFARHGVEFGW